MCLEIDKNFTFRNRNENKKLSKRPKHLSETINFVVRFLKNDDKHNFQMHIDQFYTRKL